MEHVSKLVREMVEFAGKVRGLAPSWVRLHYLEFQVNEWRSLPDAPAIDQNIIPDIESWLSFLGYLFDEHCGAKIVGRFGPGLEPQVWFIRYGPVLNRDTGEPIPLDVEGEPVDGVELPSWDPGIKIETCTEREVEEFRDDRYFAVRLTVV